MAGPARGSRIVVADDNADMREYLRGILEAQGYAVEAVEDGALALEAIRRQRPGPPPHRRDDAGDRWFASSMRSLGSFPVCTSPWSCSQARAGEEDMAEGLSQGADDCTFVKPFAAREILARVHSNLSLAADRMKSEEEAPEAPR